MISQNVDQQLGTAWEMSEDELYKHLGMASLGTESISESVGSMNMLMSIAENTNARLATESLGKNLLAKGKSLFSWLWDQIKTIVCAAYKDKINIGGKELAKYLLDIIVAAGKLTNAIAILVITIAIKKGLAKLCGAN